MHVRPASGRSGVPAVSMRREARARGGYDLDELAWGCVGTFMVIGVLSTITVGAAVVWWLIRKLVS